MAARIMVAIRARFLSCQSPKPTTTKPIAIAKAPTPSVSPCPDTNRSRNENRPLLADRLLQNLPDLLCQCGRGERLLKHGRSFMNSFIIQIFAGVSRHVYDFQARAQSQQSFR